MSSIHQISSLDQKNQAEAIEKKVFEKQQLQKQVDQNALMWAFFQILECSQVQQQVGLTQAKILEVSSQEQAKLNNQQAAFNFEQMDWSQMNKHIHLSKGNFLAELHQFTKRYKSASLTAGASAKLKAFLQGKATHVTLTAKIKVSYTQLHNMQVGNEQVEKERSFISNQLMLEQQQSQIVGTQFNSTIDNESQSLQIGSGLMQMIQTLTSQIDSSNH